MFFPGHTELLIILVIAVILFGHRLPSVARSIGESFHVFRRSVSGEDTQAS
jgi:TatA/E family protein of Tat protein translocase